MKNKLRVGAVALALVGAALLPVGATANSIHDDGNFGGSWNRIGPSDIGWRRHVYRDYGYRSYGYYAPGYSYYAPSYYGPSYSYYEPYGYDYGPDIAIGGPGFSVGIDAY
jgi:hypothetical protein